MQLSYEKFLDKLGLVDSNIAQICYEFYLDALESDKKNTSKHLYGGNYHVTCRKSNN